MTRIRTADLDIDLDDRGPREAPVVLLLHGWPDDRASWAPVAAALEAAGLRTVTPSLRGFGDTRFRSPDAPRTANAAVLAMDAVALMDALGVARFMVAGHDWGSSIAEALAIGWPERVPRIAMLASPSRLGGMAVPSFAQSQRYWYHWFMATERGAAKVREDPRGFCRLQWDNWSPPGWYDEATFERTARSWDNPDFVDITLHSYRSRWGEAEIDPSSRWLDDKVRQATSTTVPTVYFQGEVDGVNPPATSEHMAARFVGPFERVLLPGVGHFVQREAPQAVASGLVRHFASV